MKSLVLMIQFMTRYPIPLEIEFTARHFVQGMKWMPLVGLLAALPGAVGFVLADAWLGREVAAIVAVILLITVTGGLHLDGIADTADGLFSYRSRERMLEIMRDSTLGANGVIALVLTILLKFILLHNIADDGALLAVLLTPVLGRMALTWHSAVAPYAREERGIGDYVNQTGLAQAVAATLLSLCLVSVLLGMFGLRPALIPVVTVVLHLPSIVLAVLFAAYLRRRLGGITGDTIGASIELAELLSFLVFLLVWKYML
ncbi:cobalamin 5'-phosphate synthase [Desulfobulbus propionicus DSM 2032]|jgi:adenosylcobinamide-GDP ribazoletransferase|uniref:Adenosylcobinamide-GDP ribazoletransferase n=1 Tax=Desulfobulbus propionicus (strain ATCC 33891 / DSM 2032 / VKM B-1956 / 1pr3) TaxID=577650 RepID=A0A7U3YK62_DESPD|nr:adenosylcobinamide-GDP ribazoletransferase [Desulfobulbus propionicus]ADW16763.1 cobalamin 5'-phosphate synthase [Desulfobulbus propionicus DSM 2032]